MLIVDAERMSYIRNRSKDPRGSTRSYIDKSTRGIAQLNFKNVYSFKQTLLNYVFFSLGKAHSSEGFEYHTSSSSDEFQEVNDNSNRSYPRNCGSVPMVSTTGNSKHSATFSYFLSQTLLTYYMFIVFV